MLFFGRRIGSLVGIFRIELCVLLIFGVLYITGCGKEESGKEKADKAGKISPSSLEGDKEKSLADGLKLLPQDDKDDPRFAIFFPESSEVAGWVKTVPVIGADGTQINKFLPTLADVLRPFGIESVASCQYRRIYNGTLEQADVCLIRAKSWQDAYGMLSVCCPAQDKSEIGDVCRTVNGDYLFVAKGPYFLVIKGKGIAEGIADTDKVTAHLAEGIRLLAAKIVFELASPEGGGIPDIAQILQSKELPQGTVIYIRDLSSLKGPSGSDLIEELGLTDELLSKLNEILQLGAGRDTEFALGIYRSDEWLGSNVIWLAKYPTREEAIKVYASYRKVIEQEKTSDIMSNTLLKAPRERILMGCWTMETESLAHIMNKLQRYLP